MLSAAAEGRQANNTAAFQLAKNQINLYPYGNIMVYFLTFVKFNFKIMEMFVQALSAIFKAPKIGAMTLGAIIITSVSWVIFSRTGVVNDEEMVTTLLLTFMVSLFCMFIFVFVYAYLHLKLTLEASKKAVTNETNVRIENGDFVNRDKINVQNNFNGKTE
jgi:hypothetical protein